MKLFHANICRYALDHPSNPSIFNTIGFTESILDKRGDIRDTRKLRGTLTYFKPEIIFHLAAQPIVLNSYDCPVETYDTNVTGTANLLNELRKIDGIKVIIVMTSDKSYLNNE